MKDKKEKKEKKLKDSGKSESPKDSELKPTKKLLSFTRSKKPKKTQESESLKLPDFNEYRDLIEDGDDLVPEDGKAGTGTAQLNCFFVRLHHFQSTEFPLTNGCLNLPPRCR